MLRIFQYRDRYAEPAADTKDPEVNLEVFEKFLEGLCTSKLMPLAVTNIETYRDLDSQTPVVVCAVHNSSLSLKCVYRSLYENWRETFCVYRQQLR